jgi:hypothetical protein
MRCNLVIWIAVTACISGCTVQKVYDVSAMPPFSSYTDRDVKIVRNLFLLEEKWRDGSLLYSVYCPGDTYAPMILNNSLVQDRILSLKESEIHVTYTRLYYFRQTFLQGFFSTADLYSHIEIHLQTPGWPQVIEIGFDNCPALFFVGGKFDIPTHFIGEIRPAPWEPQDTPATRPIAWPNKGYLIAEGQAAEQIMSIDFKVIPIFR